jgi:hypothetical protein
MTVALTPALALEYLHALSADLRAAVVLDANGELLAGPPHLKAPATDLLAHAPTAPALEGRSTHGAAFAARDSEHAIVAVTGPHALSRLTLRDLRTALSALGRENSSNQPPEVVPATALEALLRAVSAP